MPVPTTREGHYDAMLTDFAVGFLEQPSNYYVYDKVFPALPVEHKSDVYKIFPRGYFLQDQVAPRPVGGVPREVHFRTREGNYLCIEEGLRAKTDRQETANYTHPGLSLEQSKIRLVSSQHIIHNERKWVGEFMTAGKWTTEKAGVASGPTGTQFLQLDQANRDLQDFFFGEIDEFTLRCGVAPNRLVIGRRVLRNFRKNTLLRDQVKYTSDRTISLQDLANFFDIEQVLCPQGAYNTAGGEIIDPTTNLPIQQQSYSRFIGEQNMLLTYADSNLGPDYQGGGVHFAWTGLMADAYQTPDELQSAAVVRGEWEYGEWFDVLQAWSPKIVAPDLGTLYTTAVA